VLKRLMPSVAQGNRAPWIGHINGLKGDSAVRDIQTLPDDGHLYAAHVINDLWRATRATETIVVTDVGQHQMWEAQYYHHEAPRSLITSGGLGTMGFAVPAAIGAKRARPDAEVWAVVGDGGFQMTCAELATAVIHRLPIKVLIINNAYLGMVRQWQELFFDNRYSGVDLEGNPDFVKLAEAFGCRGFRIKRNGDARRILTQAMEYNDGPCVIDACVEKEDNVFPMIPAGAAVKDMIIEKPTFKLAKPTGST
jgi:acetolactate synthase-1/2/3 large subunit